MSQSQWGGREGGSWSLSPVQHPPRHNPGIPITGFSPWAVYKWQLIRMYVRTAINTVNTINRKYYQSVIARLLHISI